MMLSCLLLECLNLNIPAGRKIELHQRIDGLLGGLENIDQPLMGADLEGLARFLVDVRGTQHAVLVLHGRQRNGPCDLRAGALRRLDDFTGGGIEYAIVVSLKPNANSLSYHLNSLRVTPFKPKKQGLNGAPNLYLLDDFADGAGAYRAATLADGKTQALFHRHRRMQLNLQLHI